MDPQQALKGCGLQLYLEEGSVFSNKPKVVSSAVLRIHEPEQGLTKGYRRKAMRHSLREIDDAT